MKTRYFRVCQSGLTIDGRNVTPVQIDQMAETYNPQVYGARIWCEHLRSVMPSDTPFLAYGDVLALKTETEADGTRVLLAQIDATDELVRLNGLRQKVYFSAEIEPNFAGTGKAYLYGLAITDSPASLGTEMIKLSIGHLSSLPGGDKMPKLLYGHAIESRMEVEPAPAPEGPSLLSRVKDLLSGNKVGDDARVGQLEQSVTLLAAGLSDIKTAITTLAAGTAPTPTPPPAPPPDGPVTRAEYNALLQKLRMSTDTPPRPPHSGDGAAVTDC